MQCILAKRTLGAINNISRWQLSAVWNSELVVLAHLTGPVKSDTTWGDLRVRL